MNDSQEMQNHTSRGQEGSTQDLESQEASQPKNASSLDTLSRHMQQQNQLLKEQLEVMKRIHWNSSQSRASADVISSMSSREFLNDAEDFLADRMVGLLETINIVRDRRLNVSRYGDGEIRLMFSPNYSVGFQKNSFELRRSLTETIEYAASAPDALLIAVPPIMRDPVWKSLFVEHWDGFREMLGPLNSLGNSHISRHKVFHSFGDAAVEGWRSVWGGRSITVVTGEGSRFELSPALFDKVRSVDFCYSKPQDAFDDIPRLITALQQDNSDIVLISLGPAGTVLAAELAKCGRWALDIGHISNSYSQVYEGAAAPESIPIKLK